MCVSAQKDKVLYKRVELCLRKGTRCVRKGRDVCVRVTRRRVVVSIKDVSARRTDCVRKTGIGVTCSVR